MSTPAPDRSGSAARNPNSQLAASRVPLHRSFAGQTLQPAVTTASRIAQAPIQASFPIPSAEEPRFTDNNNFNPSTALNPRPERYRNIATVGPSTLLVPGVAASHPRPGSASRGGAHNPLHDRPPLPPSFSQHGLSLGHPPLYPYASNPASPQAPRRTFSGPPIAPSVNSALAARGLDGLYSRSLSQPQSSHLRANIQGYSSSPGIAAGRSPGPPAGSAPVSVPVPPRPPAAANTSSRLSGTAPIPVAASAPPRGIVQGSVPHIYHNIQHTGSTYAVANPGDVTSRVSRKRRRDTDEVAAITNRHLFIVQERELQWFQQKLDGHMNRRQSKKKKHPTVSDLDEELRDLVAISTRLATGSPALRKETEEKCRHVEIINARVRDKDNKVKDARETVRALRDEIRDIRKPAKTEKFLVSVPQIRAPSGSRAQGLGGDARGHIHR